MGRAVSRLAFASGGLVVVLLTFRALGPALVVQDPLAPAEAIVVFGGEVPFRAMEAADIFHEGMAKEVWLTEGGVHDDEVEMNRLGIERPAEHSYNRLVLERLKVPAGAIHLVEGRNLNTAEEVNTVLGEAARRQADRLILVTSKFHALRVRTLWHARAGSHPQAIVRYASRDPFDADHWWRTSEDGLAVSREWFGILNAWMGFPIKSGRPGTS